MIRPDLRRGIRHLLPEFEDPVEKHQPLGVSDRVRCLHGRPPRRDERCRDVIFQVGWGNAKGDAKLTPERINQWNTENKFLRAYVSSNTLWAEMDARIARGTTANVEEYIVLWAERLHEFKPFMGL